MGGGRQLLFACSALIISACADQEALHAHPVANVFAERICSVSK
jgi:hypothetical protein